MFVHIYPGDPTVTLSQMEAVWKKISPTIPFTFSFLDEKFDNFYKEQQRWSKIMCWAGGICIFLVCLGLFGLAYLAATNRTQEIGIRKVLGISTIGVVRLLSAEFIRLVMIAFLIITPVAWYFMHQWLQDFAYRISISVWVFVAIAIGALMITLLTVSFQSIKAAVANPVKSLRTE